MRFSVLWAAYQPPEGSGREPKYGFYIGRTKNLSVRLRAHKRGKFVEGVVDQVTLEIPSIVENLGAIDDWARWIEQSYLKAFQGYNAEAVTTINKRNEIGSDTVFKSFKDKFKIISKRSGWCR